MHIKYKKKLTKGKYAALPSQLAINAMVIFTRLVIKLESQYGWMCLTFGRKEY